MMDVSRHTLHFLKPARTSRGEYTERTVYIIGGKGECSPLPDLSIDRDAYPDTDTVRSLIQETMEHPEMLLGLPALRFALETSDVPYLDSTPFAKGLAGIPINGLVWMSDEKEMSAQAEAKAAAGFGCVKFKIGALDWDCEMRILSRFRKSHPGLEMRVDANGAFTSNDAMPKLRDLSALDIHSIEQPVKAGQTELMAELCRTSPVPVALDEELIPIQVPSSKASLLESLRPAYIVLKPTLHGGITGTSEWIAQAHRLGIGSWITSALESNIGLTAVAKLAALEYGDSPMPQGLGTGALFSDNLPSGIEMRGNRIWLKG